jgi:hypothetical protein
MRGLTYVAGNDVKREIAIEDIEKLDNIPSSWPDHLHFKGQGMEPICELPDIGERTRPSQQSDLTHAVTTTSNRKSEPNSSTTFQA